MQKKGFMPCPLAKFGILQIARNRLFFIPNCKSLGLIECTLLLACSQIKCIRNSIPGRHQIQLIQDFMFVCFNWYLSEVINTFYLTIIQLVHVECPGGISTWKKLSLEQVSNFQVTR